MSHPNHTCRETNSATPDDIQPELRPQATPEACTPDPHRADDQHLSPNLHRARNGHRRKHTGIRGFLDQPRQHIQEKPTELRARATSSANPWDEALTTKGRNTSTTNARDTYSRHVNVREQFPASTGLVGPLPCVAVEAARPSASTQAINHDSRRRSLPTGNDISCQHRRSPTPRNSKCGPLDETTNIAKHSPPQNFRRTQTAGENAISPANRPTQ